MQKNKLNQSGASAIMFAMVFIVVISLLTLGFATLARRDQRAALDKTLSNEAQFAAEAGINSVTDYVDRKGTLAVSNDSCDPSAIADYSKPNFGTDGPSITCIKWDTNPTEAVKTLKPYETWSFEDATATGDVEISFSATEPGNAYTNPNPNAVGRRGLPPIANGNLPIIKVAEVAKSALSETGSPKIEIFYLVPGNKSGSNVYTSVNLGDSTTNINGNASAFGVNCDTNGNCSSIKITNDPNASGSPRLFFFQVIGTQTGKLTYKRLNGGGDPIALSDIQTKVDVNVIAQDQSKRLISYIASANTISTWQPWFAAVADSLCKDIKVDGTNAGGIIGGTACPN